MSIEIKNKNVTKIDLSNKNLASIPNEIFELKNLKKLILRNNNISVIPAQIEKLKRLETLDLSGNKISNFYAKLCTLKNLKILNLNNNKIKSLPLQIQNLKNLISLHLSYNKLNNIPNQLYKLEKLRELDISNNNISVIENDIISLKELRKIWINNLPIKTFPIRQFLPNSLICIYAFSKSNGFRDLNADYSNLSSIKGNAMKYYSEYFFDSNHLKKVINTEIMTGKKEIKKNKVFISYSHKDTILLEKVKKHLNVLTNHLEIDIDVWDDQKLEVGDVWKENIVNALNQAGIAIFLVSTDFLSSDFINKEEIPPILENAEKNGTIILPIILKVCYFEGSKLEKYQALNSPSHPLSKMSEDDVDEHLVKLTRKIHKIMES